MGITDKKIATEKQETTHISLSNVCGLVFTILFVYLQYRKLNGEKFCLTFILHIFKVPSCSYILSNIMIMYCILSSALPAD